jgi:TonB family protein
VIDPGVAKREERRQFVAMRPSRFVALVSVTLLPMAPVRSSAQSIAGRVLESVTRAPMRGLSIQLVADGGTVVVETRTDSAGIFHAMLPVNGTFRVRFAFDARTGLLSDTIGVHDDAFVQREFVLELPRSSAGFMVEKQAAVRPVGSAPRFPPSMRTRRIQGDVLARFVVDTTGLVILETFRVLRSPDVDFSTAVLAWLPNARFYPAEIDGHKVRQMVQLPFSFALADSSGVNPFDASRPIPLPVVPEPPVPSRPRP